MMNRRYFLAAGAALAAGGLAVTAGGGQNLFLATITDDFYGDTLTPVEAHAAAKRGEIVLVDIRRPNEWTETGSGEGAVRLDMRREDFTSRLATLVSGDKQTPVALICARGVRSAALANQMKSEGFTRIIDVPEGMLGSSAGPGWLRRGLPLNKDD